jgi:hypothetical protein
MQRGKGVYVSGTGVCFPCGTQKYRQPPNAVQKTRFLPREFLFLAAALFLIPIP